MKEITCIVCPKGCTLTVDRANGKVTGNSCDRGKDYGLAEVTNPTRVLTTTVAHLIGSVLVKTLGLAQYYSMPLLPLMGWRLLNYVIVGVAEAFALCLLLRHKGLTRLAKGG